MIHLGSCGHTPGSVSDFLKGYIKTIVNLKFYEMSINEGDLGVYADIYL